MNKPSIKISRTGSSRNCGWSSIEMVLHILCCDENGMILEANCVMILSMNQNITTYLEYPLKHSRLFLNP